MSADDDIVVTGKRDGGGGGFYLPMFVSYDFGSIFQQDMPLDGGGGGGAPAEQPPPDEPTTPEMKKAWALIQEALAQIDPANPGPGIEKLMSALSDLGVEIKGKLSFDGLGRADGFELHITQPGVPGGIMLTAQDGVIWFDYAATASGFLQMQFDHSIDNQAPEIAMSGMDLDMDGFAFDLPTQPGHATETLPYTPPTDPGDHGGTGPVLEPLPDGIKPYYLRDWHNGYMVDTHLWI